MKRLALTRPQTLVHAVAERLHQAIIDAELKLGEVLSEDGLATSFGVSRTPVREALSLLQLQGLIEIAPQRGSFVFRPTVEDIERLCEFRVALETSVAPLAAARAHTATMAALEERLARIERSFRSRDGIGYLTSDDSLHHALFEHCGNSYFQTAYALIASKAAALRTNLAADRFADQEVSLGEHRLIVQYFRAGDLRALTSLLATHIERTRRTLVEAFEQLQQVARPSPRESYPFRLPE
jgi:DNA-binding GntR family transcriptional regulator